MLTLVHYYSYKTTNIKLVRFCLAWMLATAQLQELLLVQLMEELELYAVVVIIVEVFARLC